jgi:DNA-binding GntR family transcriptional regulator
MTTTFQKIEPVSKKTRVIVLLRDAISSGVIKAGDQIVEAKLAQQFGVGQGLIREALIELEHQGFVQRTPFSGTSVPTLTLEDAQQIFELRIELEPLAFSMAAQKVKESDVAELKDVIRKTRLAHESEDLDSFFENHLNFRKIVWKLSGNRYLQQALERVVVPLYALYFIRRPYNRDGILQTVVDCIEHQDKLMDAFQNRDSDRARIVARDFLTRMREYLGTRLVPEPNQESSHE